MNKILLLIALLINSCVYADIESELYKAIEVSELEITKDLLSDLVFSDQNTKNAYIKHANSILELRTYDLYKSRSSKEINQIRNYALLGTLSIFAGMFSFCTSFPDAKFIGLGSLGIFMGILSFKKSMDIDAQLSMQQRQLHKNAQEICHLIMCKKVNKF